MAASYINNFDTETTGTLPAGWVGFASPSGTAGNALVSATNPIFGTKSLSFAAATDAMAERYTAKTAQDHGIYFAQRVRVNGGNSLVAGALVGTDGNVGYFCYVDVQANQVRILRVPSYGYADQASDSQAVVASIGRTIVDNDLLWCRAERRGSTGVVQFKVWLDGSAEPANWGLAITNLDTGSAAANCGLRISGGSGDGSALIVDALQVYDLAQLNPALPFVRATANSTASLYAPGASGGTAPYTYQWQRALQGGTLKPISGATSLVLNDTGLTSGTAYVYALQTTDSAGTTATSSPLQLTTTGTPPPTVTAVTVAPASPTVIGGTTQAFTATVTGTNNPGQVVTWTTSLGSITAAGVLTAPAPLDNTPQVLTVTATSTVDSTKAGTATVTVPATAPPAIKTVTVASGDGVDVISYPAPTAGARPVTTVALLVGTTPGGQAATPVAVNIGAGAGQFVYPSGGYRYTVVAADAGTPPLLSAPSNEAIGAIAPRGLPTTFAQTMAIVRNALSTFFPPALLAGLAKLQANALEVDVLSIAGSNLAASNLRDEEISQTLPQAALTAFGTVAAAQLQTVINTALPPALLAGLAKLENATLDVNVVSFAGSTTAANNLRDEELSQAISTAAVNAISTATSTATAALITVPTASATATAVWNNVTRTLTSTSTASAS